MSVPRPRHVSPLVSIGIPTLSTRPRELREAIGSVLDQRFSDLEVVVSDNGRAGDAVVRSIADDRVHYFANATNEGMAANFTRALDRSRGELIGLCMDDDRLLPDFVARAVACFRSDPTLDVVFADHYFDRDGTLTRRHCELPGGKYPSFLRPLLDHQPFALSAALMRRRAWDATRPFPDLLTADIAFAIRAAVKGFTFYYLDQPLMSYRVHAGQLSSGETRFRDDNVRLWEMFQFDDPDCERIRRVNLARSLVYQAASLLRAGRFEDARVAANKAAAMREKALSGPERIVTSLGRSRRLARLSGWALTKYHALRVAAG